MRFANQKVILFTLLTALLATPIDKPAVWAESDPFPNYTSIQPNVAFWINIFTRYSSQYAVIHDNQEMERIYGVIELVNSEQPGSRKNNRKRIKKSKEEYKIILEKLMRGEAPVGPLEQRVVTLFRQDAKPEEFRRAIKNIRGQIGLKDRFRAGMIRSGAYIDEIKQIFRNEGLPEDLAYLPHVESSFNPKARSKSGAVGTWQFTRSTGKLFMKINDVIDERRDPIWSSHAAAKLLKKNFLKLESWPLAITAYNHGTSGMLRARKAHGSYESILKSYQSRSFGFASRNFYSEFLAAREVARNYRKFFGELKFNLPRKECEIVLTGYVSLSELGRHLKLNLEDIRHLNPVLGKAVFLGQKYAPKGYPLRLPASSDRPDWISRFSKLPPTLYHEKQKRNRVHIVRRGDTADKIARRYRVKLNALVAANQLDTKARIYVNQKIKIPFPNGKTVKIARN